MIAPINTTAGVGHINQDITIIVLPSIKNAITLFTISLLIGDIIISSAPISLRTLDIQFTIDIIIMISINSLPDTVIALYIIITVSIGLKVYKNPITAIPKMHTQVTSFFIIIVRIIAIIIKI
ncbi:hypothetical protein SDC9_164094 [bioreactor metagenome]|uniref:Uncharacterized protein n=1 Tax=bioreactor metagenome TaxID=1076179 RepID=A0A645FTG1_9ZZZZ